MQYRYCITILTVQQCQVLIKRLVKPMLFKNIGFRTYAYSLAQAFAMANSIISVAIAALVGMMLAPSEMLTTLPYGLQFLGIIVSSYLFSYLMKKQGRKRIFLINTLFLLLSGIMGFYSIYLQSFILNCLTHFILGVALSGFAYFRFAATDGLADEAKPVAVSMVTFGGVLAALFAPIIAKKTRLILEQHEFAISYLCFSMFAVAMFILFLFIPNDKPTTIENKQAKVNKEATKIPINRLLVAVYSSSIGAALMSILMMQSSLKLKAMGTDFSSISFVIQAHVLAMFLPSFFMGNLIARMGVEKVLLLGYITMTISSLIAILTTGYNGILVALIALGLGWNMLYVGGSSLVAVLPGDTHRLQGTNETTIAILSAIGAFSAGLLFASIGWINSNIVAMVFLLPGLILLLKSWRSIQQS